MARHLEETDIPIEYKGMKYNVSPSALRSNNLTVELPEVKVLGKRKNKGYKSAFNPNGAGEFAATMMNSPLQLADYAFNRFIDAGKGEHGKTDYRYTPIQTTMQRVGETLSPTRWAGTLRSGFKESPWSENNPGLTGNPYLDMITDAFTIPVIAKGTKAGYLSTPMGKYTSKRGTWYSPIEYTLAHTPAGKRAIEVGMRSSGSDNPIPVIKSDLKNIFKHKDKNKVRDILKYIITGKNNTNKPISLSNMPYQGYGYNNGKPDYSFPDVVDAYLYGKTPNSRIFKEVGEDIYTANAIKENIKNNYSNKNIKYYEMIDDVRGINEELPSYVKPEHLREIGDDLDFLARNNGDSYGGVYRNAYDAAGHRVQSYTDLSGNYERRQDIWKYNPKDYASKYFKSNLYKNYEDWARHNKLKDFALNALNEAGTPIVVRTPWEKTSPIRVLAKSKKSSFKN